MKCQVDENQVDKMSYWWNVRLTKIRLAKHQVDVMWGWQKSGLQIIKLTKFQVDENQVDKMSYWQNVRLTKIRLTKCQVDETSSWWYVRLMKHQVDETSGWQNIVSTKHCVDKMSGWRNNAGPLILTWTFFLQPMKWKIGENLTTNSDWNQDTKTTLTMQGDEKRHYNDVKNDNNIDNFAPKKAPISFQV